MVVLFQELLHYFLTRIVAVSLLQQADRHSENMQSLAVPNRA